MDAEQFSIAITVIVAVYVGLAFMIGYRSGSAWQ